MNRKAFIYRITLALASLAIGRKLFVSSKFNETPVNHLNNLSLFQLLEVIPEYYFSIWSVEEMITMGFINYEKTANKSQLKETCIDLINKLNMKGLNVIGSSIILDYNIGSTLLIKNWLISSTENILFTSLYILKNKHAL